MNGSVAEAWNPWDLIYPKAKGTGLPNYNPNGKYCVKLFWMGTWRKLTIDDQMPCNKKGQLLLPVSQQREIWLPLLCKAILKIAAIDYQSDLNPHAEFGDCSIVHLLTGWLPEPIPIRSGHRDSIWRLMKSHLPKWSPLPVSNKTEEPENQPEASSVAAPLPSGKAKPGGGSKDSAKGDAAIPPFKREEYPIVVFAAYADKSGGEAQEQATADFSLVKAGLPPAFSHAVLVTQTRREPLERPRPPDPDSLIPKFAYQGFKGRRQREEEAQRIAKELAAIDSELVEVASPLLRLTDSGKKNEAMWMKYDEFVNCFTTLYVFHKPGGYEFKRAIQDMKMIISTSSSKKWSGSNLNDSGGSHYYNSHAPATQVGMNGVASYLLCVDNTKPIEIVINLSILPQWPYRTTTLANKAKSKASLDSIRESESDVSLPGGDGGGGDQYTENGSSGGGGGRVLPGIVIIEEYKWDSLVTGQPLLKIKTTGTKAAALCLPSGRHLIRMIASAPLGYHLELWSLTRLAFDEEDNVFHELTKESLRYQTHALNVFSTIVVTVSMFEEPELFRNSFYHQGLGHRGRDIEPYHCKLLLKSLYHMLSVSLGDAFTNEMAFAWKAFSREGMRLFLRGLEKGLPSSANEFLQSDSAREVPIPENWIDREPSPEEESASVVIQAAFRGYWQRKIWKTLTKDTEEHQRACQLLDDSLEILKSKMEKASLTLFNTLFKMDPQLLSKFPFKDDEWSRAIFEDHEGHYKEQPANSWFVMFREVFYVAKHGVLVVPHLYTSVQTCSLRVFNNDTGEEIPRVFQRVAPYVYVRNKRGYTFVAEGRTADEPIPAGWCRLRLIGTEDQLLKPKNNGIVNCQFFTETLREYYLPNRQYVFFRLAVSVKNDVQVSLQIETSKPTVYVRVQILDTIDGSERAVAFGKGKGHAVIPSFTFLKDRVPLAEEAAATAEAIESKIPSPPTTAADSDIFSRTASRASTRAASRQENESADAPAPAPGEEAHSAEVDDNATDIFCPLLKEQHEPDNHKYIIQAAVMRDSWNVKESAWPFVSVQKAEEDRREREMLDTRAPSQMSERLSSNGKRSKSKGGGSKGKVLKGPPAKPSFDPSVPHWTMKVVTLEEQKDLIELKKDTEREEEIKAMKKAWEEAEPGRAEKAKATRLKFLEGRTEKIHGITEEKKSACFNVDKSSSDIELASSSGNLGVSTSVSRVTIASGNFSLPSTPGSPVPDLSGFVTRCPIRQHDFSRFYILPPPNGGRPILLDDEEMAVRQARREEEMNRYRKEREKMLEAREMDREARNQMKLMQLEEAERRQADLDEARCRISMLREACRKRIIDEKMAPLQLEEASASFADNQPSSDEACRKRKKSGSKRAQKR